MIETNEALDQAFEIARSSQRVRSLIFGAIDMAADLRTTIDWENLLFARSRVVHAAAGAGVDLIDVPWLDLEDMDGLREEARRCSSLGFTGKAAIHPKQIPVLNETFSPAEEEVARARQIIAAFEAGAGGLVVHEGKLIEKPVPALDAADRRHRRRAVSQAPSAQTPVRVRAPGIAIVRAILQQRALGPQAPRAGIADPTPEESPGADNPSHPRAVRGRIFPVLPVPDREFGDRRDLVRDIGLSASEIGLLTSVYFLTFALFQLPLGLLLDRFGPRRVNATLLLIAATGAGLFAIGEDSATLIAGRALIGLGTCACTWPGSRRSPNGIRNAAGRCATPSS